MWNLAIEQADPTYIALLIHGESVITFLASVFLLASAILLVLRTKLKGRYIVFFGTILFVLSSIALGLFGSIFGFWSSGIDFIVWYSFLPRLGLFFVSIGLCVVTFSLTKVNK